PSLGTPRVGDLAALEDDMVDRALGEAAAHGESGVAGADDDRRCRSNGTAPDAADPARSVDLDRDVRRIGDDVVDRGTLLRLRHQGLDLVTTRVGVDLVGDLDAAEPVAHVAVDTEDALKVHRSLDGRRDRSQLNLAMLRDGSNARGETASQRDEHELHGGCPVVLRGENLWMVRVETECRLVLLLVSQAEK